MMRTCPHCGNAFAHDERFCPHDGTSLRASETLESIPGTIIAGRYEIVKELGHGGMGVVYLANHIRMDRLCAVKLLRADRLQNSDAVARFHQEAKNASRIAHPNVVAVYDFGETEENVTYLAMEYVDGIALSTLLADVGALSPRRTARIIWQAANAVSAAHDLKIVHRDLKPNNIILTRYRQWDDFVKVLDFGIAKAFGTTTSPDLTSTGFAVGTPGYMSPEQEAGLDVDHRSDIFALGMLAVRLLAGSLPHPKPRAYGSGEELLRLLPTAADWPEDVRQALGAALEFQPESRLGSAVAFASAFAAAVSNWVPAVPGVREPWEGRLSDIQTRPAPANQQPVGIKVRPPERIDQTAVRTKPSRRRAVFAGATALALMTGAAFVARGVMRQAGPKEPTVDTSMVRGGIRGDTATSRVDSQVTGGSLPRDGQRHRRQRDSTIVRMMALTDSVGPPLGSALADSVARLRQLLDLDTPIDDSARYAVAFATRLLARPIQGDTRAAVLYLRAEARLLLEDASAACEDLRFVRQGPPSTFTRAADTLIERHCTDPR